LPDRAMTDSRIVIVGCGRIAGGFNEQDEGRVLTHVAAYRKLGAAIVGCCDLDRKKAQAFAGRWSVPRYDTDIDALLKSTQPDVVSICTPPAGRVPVMERVFDAPSVRAVLIEKPVAARYEETQSIARLAQGWARPVLVNYGRAFDPFYRRVRSDWAKGAFGPWRQVVARYYGSARTNASHLIERILDMAGPPVCAQKLSGPDDAPVFEISFGTTGATAVFLPSPGCEYAPLELDLLFERGRIRIVDSERRMERFISRPDENFRDVFNLVPAESFPAGGPSHENVFYAVQEVLRVAKGEPVAADVFRRGVLVDWVLDQINAS